MDSAGAGGYIFGKIPICGTHYHGDAERHPVDLFELFRKTGA